MRPVAQECSRALSGRGNCWNSPQRTWILSKVAQEDGQVAVHFAGVEVRDKCVAIAVQTDQPDETVAGVREISR